MAVRFDHYGDVDVLEVVEVPRPVPGPGQVLVKVVAAGINPGEASIRKGLLDAMWPASFPSGEGSDLAGVVEESSSPLWKAGDSVIVTGSGLSETIWGGYAEYARIDARHLVKLPESMTPRQAMGIGTAGFTAMQCVIALERHGVTPGSGAQGGASGTVSADVVVTGAAGGVGSVAIAILAKLGYRVFASTGRAELAPYLRSLGASEIIDRTTLAAPSKRPMDSERWAGAVDTVGGETLAGIIRTLKIGASVAACGLAGGATLNTTVYPFILRGVNLLGVNSVTVPRAERLEIWRRLALDLPLSLLDSMMEELPLDRVIEAGEKILAGAVRGRTVIRVA